MPRPRALPQVKLTIRLPSADLVNLDALRLPGETRSGAAARLLREALHAPQHLAALADAARRLERLLSGTRADEAVSALRPTGDDLGITGLLDAFNRGDAR